MPSPPSPKPFQQSRTKIGRARKLAEELSVEVAAYIARDPYCALVMRKKATNHHFIGFLNREFVPDTVTTIFGDILHNLRSALDLLANDLVALSGSTPKRVYFPFAISESELPAQIGDKMKGATPEVIQMITALKPYRNGNEALRALHDLNVRDKHVALLGAGAGGSISFGMDQMTVGHAPGWYHTDFSKTPYTPIDTTGFPVEEGDEILGKAAEGETNVHIGEGLPLAGNDVLETVAELTGLVEEIVELFESHFLGQQNI